VKTLLLIFQFLPLVLSAVRAIEAEVGAGNGATKKQLVLNSIQAAAQVGEKADDNTVKAVAALVDHTVATLNDSGIFQKAK
jgi:hypothetical protein